MEIYEMEEFCNVYDTARALEMAFQGNDEDNEGAPFCPRRAYVIVEPAMCKAISTDDYKRIVKDYYGEGVYPNE